jgi:hypothetical protein
MQEQFQIQDIYVLPTHPGALLGLKKAYNANSLDLIFPTILTDFEIFSHMSDIGDENSNEALAYTFNLGFKTFAPLGADMLMLPRSSSGNLNKQSLSSSDIRHTYGKTSEEFNGTFQNIFFRSSLKLTNTVGYIDSDYRGEWIANIYLDGYTAVLKPGKAYLQAVPVEPSKYRFKIVETISEVPETLRETQRGSGGFGSSG